MKEVKPMSKLETQVVVAEQTVTSLATKWGMGGGTAASIYGWVTSSTGAVLIGVIVTILGFIINLIYQHKRNCREAEEVAFRRVLALAEEERRAEMHKAQLEAIKYTQDTP